MKKLDDDVFDHLESFSILQIFFLPEDSIPVLNQGVGLNVKLG